MGDLRSGGGSEELVHRPALVGLDMSEGDPAQPIERQDGRDRLGDRGEHRPVPGMEEEWLLGVDEELVEAEPVRPDLGQQGGDPVDALSDLVDPGGCHRTPAPCATEKCLVARSTAMVVDLLRRRGASGASGPGPTSPLLCRTAAIGRTFLSATRKGGRRSCRWQ